jgi:hypothetical protein
LENNNEYAGYDEDMQKYLSRNETNLAEFNKVKTVVPVVTEVAPTVKKRSKTGFFSHFFPKKKKNESKKSIVQPKTEKLDDESEEEIVEKEEIPKVSRDSNLSEEAIICHEQAKELIQKAEEYHSRYPADPRISISDLKGAGLLKGTVHCPEGGRYVILLEGETVTVDCINTGGTGHGTIRANNGGKE